MKHRNDLLYQSMATARKQIDPKHREFELAQLSGYIKMITGVTNNCTYAILCHCYNEVAGITGDRENNPKQPHPRFRNNVKRAFRDFFTAWRRYEYELLYPAGNKPRFFHLADMNEDARSIYGKMTDAQYFEFWKSTGALSFQRSMPLVTSLHNKFRISLDYHNVPYAQQTAWALVGDIALMLAIEVYERAVRSCKRDMTEHITDEQLKWVWSCFSLERLKPLWLKALLMLSPESEGYDLEDMEKRNIGLGVNQLRELWASADLPFDSTIRAIDDYSDEIFRTKGVAKKAMRQMAEMREEAKKGLTHGRPSPDPSLYGGE